MSRDDAIDLIARGEYRWGMQRSMLIRDKRGHELPKGRALDELRAWAGGLPESTFLDYVGRHAPAYLED
jgi:hypothetical protein